MIKTIEQIKGNAFVKALEFNWGDLFKGAEFSNEAELFNVLNTSYKKWQKVA